MHLIGQSREQSFHLKYEMHKQINQYVQELIRLSEYDNAYECSVSILMNVNKNYNRLSNIGYESMEDCY